jgi:AcrR family transcriptional regulator
MRATNTKTEIRQEQIAQAALALIARRGVAGLSVAGVAKEVGVVPSGIYRHYRSKDEILDVVLDLISQRLLGNVQAVRVEVSDPLDRLHRLLLRHLELIRTHSGIPRVVLSEEIFAGQPKRRHKVYRMISSYLSEVAILVREAQANGQTQPDVSPDAAAVMFLGLIQPAAILWLMSDGKFDIDQHAEHAWQFFSIMLGQLETARATPPPADVRKEPTGERPMKTDEHS